MEYEINASKTKQDIAETEASEQYVIIRQLPIIEEKLAELGRDVKAKVTAALALDCTEATVKEVKATRAELNKINTSFEDKRKAVKAAIMAPYNEFEDIYKREIGNIFKDGDARLSQKINAVEGQLKQAKSDELKAYFDEYAQACALSDITFERWNPNITLSASLKSLKESAVSYINIIVDCLIAIEDMEHREEIEVEYMKSLNLSSAITLVTQRHQALEEQSKRKAESEARKLAENEAVKKVDAVVEARSQPLPPPVETTRTATDDPVLTVSFTVKHYRSRLKDLKQYLIDGGYEIL